jgi:hypothetical protein
MPFQKANPKTPGGRTLASLTAEELAKLLAAIQTYEGWKEGRIVPVTAG